ncbi:MAG: outer membrane lipid asymmetry maintenance protein MlaD, partial [Nitrospinae bacterium RIFCSPLOWO2_12_FULL_47_7]
MKKLSLEMFVGIFMVLGIACLGWISIKLGKKEILGANYYTIYADFQSIAGLRENAEVEIAGVNVGSTGKITLHKNMARVELRINNNIKLSDDTIISIKTRGLIGDKVIDLS